MQADLAVLFVPDHIACTKDQQPLMLRPVLFCPILTWMCRELQAQGIRRLFIVSDSSAQEQMRPLVPDTLETVFVDGAKHGEELLSLMDGNSGGLIVISGAAVPVGVFGGGVAYSTTAEAFCKVLRDHGGYAALPEGREALAGFVPVGDAEELQSVQSMCRRKIVEKLLAQGVQILDENAVYVDPRVTIGAGTMLLPGTILRGECSIGSGCTIGPNTMLTDCVVGDDTTVNASQATDSRIGSHTNVGPFAYLRPNSVVGDHVKVGDFVEVKNSTIGNGTKISHLTYVGDSDVGEGVNFGCGTVTTNYDGFHKYRCTIEDKAFIGCNTNLIAPVRVGEGSYIAAGSTIDRDVPADSLAIARERQTVRDGWAAARRTLAQQEKKN